MKIKIYIALLIFASGYPSFAQTIFEKKHKIATPQSMTGRCIVQNVHGDFFEHGSQYTDFFTGTSQLYIAKFSNTGNAKWNRNYYNTSVGNNTLHAKGMVALSDGGIIICGFVLSPDSVTDYDIMVTRLDSSGTVMWSKMIGDSISHTDNEGAVGIIETTDGNFVISGSTRVPLPNADFYAKLSPAGNILWQKRFMASQETYGCKNMAATANGGFAIGGNKLMIIKFDSGGNQLWKTVPDFPTTKAARATTICKTNDGGYAVAGIAGELSGGNVVGDSRDIAIAKYDSIGTLQWIKKYISPKQDFPAAILQDAAGNFIVGGTHGSTLVGYEYATLLFTDNAGNSIIAKAGPVHQSCFYNMKKCADGGYIFTGNSTNDTTFSRFPITVKCDSTFSLPCFIPYTFIDSSYTLTATYTGTFALTNTVYHTRNFLMVYTDSNTVSNYCAGLDVNSVSGENSFELFPNPASSFIKIKFSDSNYSVRYRLCNMLGKTIDENFSLITNSELKIDVSRLSKGIYFIETEIDGKGGGCKKFVVL